MSRPFSVEPLRVTSLSIRTAEVYSFRFEGLGWAIVQVDEASGTFSIHSDYGDWAYSWPERGRGTKTLKEFIVSAGTDYMAEKFFYGRKTDEFNFDDTIDVLKLKVIELRRARDVSKEEAREWFNDIVDIEDVGSSEEMFAERLPPSIWNLCDNEPWHFHKHSKVPAYLWLRDGLLPPIKEVIKNNLVSEEIK